MMRPKRQLESVRTNQCRYCKEPAEDCVCITVSCCVASPNPLFDAMTKPSVVAHLKKKHIRLGKHRYPDITFMDGLSAPSEVPENTILFERADDCEVVRSDMLENPNVLSIVKSHASEHALEHPKVMLGLTYLNYTKLDGLAEFSKSIDHKEPRPIDVSFVGSVYRNPRELFRHREALLNVLEQMKAETRMEIVVGKHKWKYLNMDYYRHLAETKIVVSPFGHGPLCYRDWEAILGGCVLIKPRYDTACLFHPPRLECKPNWEDLEELIIWAMENYTALSSQAETNRKNAIASRKPAKMAELIANIVHRAVTCGSKLTLTSK